MTRRTKTKPVATKKLPTNKHRRSKSAAQKKNADNLLNAMFDEANKFGLDNLRSARVAALAGLTTGAIYSRYENADEMLIALWQERVGTPFLQHIRDVVQYVQGVLPTKHPVLRMLERPSATLRLGAEFLVVAARNDAVAEVVTPAVVAVLDDLGLNEHSDALAGAIVMISASAAIGTASRSFITGTNPGWSSSLLALRSAATRAVPLPHEPFPYDMPGDQINTGNPIRDLLLTSAEQIVGRVGFRNATVTRIARRAGFSTSAIYQMWPDKDAMLDEAIHETSLLDFGQNARAKVAASTTARGDFGFSDSWYFGLMPSRRLRHNFRLECVIASRHRPSTRRELQEYVKSADSILHVTFPKIPHATIAQIASMEQALGYGYLTLNPFVSQASQLDYFSIMVVLASFAQLS
ncbi:MAG: TetR/AcrR family transcriptional regulator [Acidimicrobiaceae bacterium]|nr:TetR/AcrR family transcriptional regulator [Acidimicrobiaceae bacterium]